MGVIGPLTAFGLSNQLAEVPHLEGDSESVPTAGVTPSFLGMKASVTGRH